MGISFFNIPQHRVFHYEPRYWNESKERIDQLKAEKARAEGKEAESEKEPYVPGKYIRGNMRKGYYHDAEKSNTNAKIKKVMTFVTLVIAFVIIYFVVKYYSLLIK